MIERRVRPQERVMALRTERRREACRDVVRHSTAKCRRAVPGRLVAPVAVRIRGGEVIVVAHMAIGAGCHFAGRGHLVRARQRPTGCCVIKHNVRPQRRAVAGGAIGRGKRSSRRRVRRIIGLLPGRQMAPGIPAIRRADLQIVIVVDVAVRTGIHLARRRHLMRVSQRETSGGVVKIRGLPGNGVMASGAGRNRKDRGRGRMLGVGRLLPRCKMATGIAAVRRCDFQAVVAAHMAI